MRKILYALFLAAILSGCGKYQSETVPVSELAYALSFSAGIENLTPQSLTEGTAAAEYGISPEEIEAGVAYCPRDKNTPDEIIVVKVKHHSYLRNVEIALKSQANDLSAAWRHNNEESAKIENRLLKTRGLYVVLAVTHKADLVEKTFDGMIVG